MKQSESLLQLRQDYTLNPSRELQSQVKAGSSGTDVYIGYLHGANEGA